MNALQPLEYSNQRILTTQMIAQAYETDEKRISENFSRNKDRYIAGKHYFYLEGENLKEFLRSANCGIQNPEKTRSLYLWTKKGAFMHAKSLNTDKAWEAYESLVDGYYFYKEIAQGLQQEPTEAIHQPLQGRGWEAVLQAMSKDELMQEIRYERAKLRYLEAIYHRLFPQAGRIPRQAEVLALAGEKEVPDLSTELLVYFSTLEGKHVTASYIRQYGPGSLRDRSADELTKELNTLASAGMLQKEMPLGKIVPRFFHVIEAGK